MKGEIFRAVNGRAQYVSPGRFVCSVVVTEEANGYAIWFEDSRDAEVVGSPEMLTWFPLAKRELAINVAKLHTQENCLRHVTGVSDQS